MPPVIILYSGEMMDKETVYQASTLIYKGLNSKSNPLRDKEYKELIDFALSSADFMEAVEAISSGLKLSIIDLSEKGIILVPQSSESIFSMGVMDYRKELKGDGADASIGLAALIQIAIAFTIFPTDDELDDSDSLLTRSTTVKEICDLIIKISKEIIKDEDGADIPDELKTTAEVILGLPETIPTQVRPTFKSLSGAVSIVINHLEANGLLKFEESMSGGFYFPTYRYHMLLKRRGAGRLLSILKEKEII